MNARTVPLALTLLAFLGLTGYVLVTYGVVGWIPPVLENWATRLVTIDLCLSLLIACGFMIQDARTRRLNPWPFVVIAILTGAAGPLAYLVLRFSRPT